MEKIKNTLDNKHCLKLILGAGNEDIKEVEKLVYVYAKAGFNMFDICAKQEVLTAAKSGLTRAKADASICVSVGISDDIHLLKAVINKQKCIHCGKCINICPQNAIFEEDGNYIINDKKCIGCSRCTEECSQNAIIKESKYKAPYTMLLPLLAEKIDCVEFHCSTDKFEEIIDNLNKIKSIYSGMISVCLDRSKLSGDKIISLLSEIIKDKDDYSYIVQADGKAMSGSENTYNATLQTVAFAQYIESNKLPVYVILSGGTNALSAKLAKECSVYINGIALGSYARKIVKKYTDNDNFFENESLQNDAINEALKLKDEIIKYL